MPDGNPHNEHRPLERLITRSEAGYFGDYGGRYVSEMLVPTMDALAMAYSEALDDPGFQTEYDAIARDYVGRPTPLYFAENLTRHFGGAQIYIKYEGLAHTGAHKINHVVGQALLAKRMGKARIIAETGAGQHGLATSAACARFDLPCTVYMGAKDYNRQRPNVFWMERMGATVIPVREGQETLRDAVNAAMKDLLAHPHDTHYLLGTACGPHPYPAMNAYFQSVVGREIRAAVLERHGRLPDQVIACVGGGSNALGAFTPFLDDPEVELVGVEAGGRGITGAGRTVDHAARMQTGGVGIAEGFKSYFLQSADGQLQNTHSISAGLDYSGVSPQMAYLRDTARVRFAYATDEDVLDAYQLLARKEGIISALESAHALVEAFRRAPDLSPDTLLVINLSGRGDKDLFITAPRIDPEGFGAFLDTQADAIRKGTA